jgi:hypothetical protein
MTHTYPSKYGPDHPSPFIRMSWALLDNIAPGAIPNDARYLLAGMIAGALDQAYRIGLDGRSADELADGPNEPELVLHAVDNYLGRIDHLWAALSIDDGGEGLCAAPLGGVTLPLIAADKRRLDLIKPLARKLARMSGKPVRITKFGERTDVEIYRP